MENDITEFERLLELKNQYDKMEQERIEAIALKRAELLKIQNEIITIETPFNTSLRIIDDNIHTIRQDFLDLWIGDGKQITDEETGIILTRKTRETPEVHDEKGLLTQAINFDEMPIKKISWDNSKLKALISAGVIKKEVASLTESFELAVTYPKEV